MQVAAADLWPDRLPNVLDRLPDQGLLLAHGRRRVADDEGAGHVGPAPRALVAGPEVDLDRQPGGQRSRTGLMAEALPDRGDDDVRRRRRPAGRARVADRLAHRLGLERRPVEPQRVPVGLGAGEGRLGGRHPGLRRPLGAADPLELGGRLDPAAGGERLRVGRQLDPVGAQAVGDARAGTRDRRAPAPPPSPPRPGWRARAPPDRGRAGRRAARRSRGRGRRGARPRGPRRRPARARASSPSRARARRPARTGTGRRSRSGARGEAPRCAPYRHRSTVPSPSLPSSPPDLRRRVYSGGYAGRR